MNTVNTPHPSDNTKTDPLLAFVARAQAHAHLWCEAEIAVDDLYALVDQRPDFMREDEAVLIIRCATRQIYKRRKVPQ